MTMLTWYYRDISYEFYLSIFITWILFTAILIFISQKIKEMIILLKTKRDLIHTIRSILQIFPEGVIIKSIDPVTQKTVIKFANDVANQFVDKIDDTTISENLKVNRELGISQTMEIGESLSNFLNEQELNIDAGQFSCSSQIVKLDYWFEKIEEIKEHLRKIEDVNEDYKKSEFYNIKSIKVQWDGLDSFMHVFINTTQVYLRLRNIKSFKISKPTLILVILSAIYGSNIIILNLF